MTDDLTFLPPHESAWAPGFHAYSRCLSAKPGEWVDLHLSGEGPVGIEVLRLSGDKVAQGAVIASLPPVEAKPQPIHRGSYVYVERGLERAAALSAEVWCRPLGEAPQRGLFHQRGFGLWLEGERLCFDVGGHRVSGGAVSLKEWHHAVGVWETAGLRLYLDGQLVGEGEGPAAFAGGGPLRLGALADEEGRTCALFTGDLCGPTLYEYAHNSEVIGAHFQAKDTEPAGPCAGHWKFDHHRGLPCRDVSVNGRHGKPVNYPIRMVPGPRCIGDSDWHNYDPASDPNFGHALRLMGDALVDCRWPVAAQWQVPAEAQSGQYAIRLRDQAGQVRHVYFVVRPRHPRARLMCLSTTNTRIAYNFRPFDNLEYDYGAYHPHPRYPILGQLHGVGRPATGELWERTTVEFELPFYTWLDKHGIPYDLFSEWDLEADPSLLDRYPVVAFAGHSEYWTADHYQRLQRFVERGGHILSLSGNTAYWRVSLDMANRVMEVRKHARLPAAGITFDPMVDASHHHQLDGLPGATMREAGFPEWGLLGGMSNGWTTPPLDGPRAGYQVLAPQHWVFNAPRQVGAGFPFADQAAGYETDLSLQTLLERCGQPALARYPDRSGRPEPLSAPIPGWAVLARALLPGSTVLDFDNRQYIGEMASEMLLREVGGEGLIFAAGSVLSSHVLGQNEGFSRMLFNIMERMGLEVPA
ncbi:MAG: LamG domain-containing protein [Candidatus Handelsmanbacteria bacterium]|nr:LamG domain-containing protein [Candidatus Handelsmanbacteria bacterium]